MLFFLFNMSYKLYIMKTAKQSTGHDTRLKSTSPKTENPVAEKDEVKKAEEELRAQTAKKAPRKRSRIL